MSKKKKIILGILSFLPIAYIFIFISFIFFVVFSAVTSQATTLSAHAPSTFPFAIFLIFPLIFIFHFLVIALIIGLQIYYIIDITRGGFLDQNNKIIWIILLLFLGIMIMPVYWYLYIWRRENGIIVEKNVNKKIVAGISAGILFIFITLIILAAWQASRQINTLNNSLKNLPNSSQVTIPKSNKPTHPIQPMACPTDAKLCPDGQTYVSRSGPNCEFEACPEINNPSWINDLINQEGKKPVANPPASLSKCEYNKQVVYFMPAKCCDQFSVLYDENGNVICAPDGGFTGNGDGRCKDYHSTKKNCTVIWKDSRTYPENK